ncbi:MAG: CotH kinase family protein, partial [Verrucomicrobiota bacterium]
VRYRIRAGETLIAPDPTDPQPNFAYFIYDGVSGWSAAINPSSSNPAQRRRVEFSTEIMGSVQVYHFIASKAAVENTTWYRPSNIWDPRSRHQYRHTGTIVAGGQVYDHVRFRVRGGEWRHAMGKNMWKFDFPRRHHLKAVDDFGQPYKSKWEKLNLGACIQQGDYRCRGEHGLFEAATYRLFNLAGVPAPRTHYVHLRIVTGREENPPNQYEGDFWGLYLATEELDDNFLKEHQLPDGNIYKWDFGRPKLEHQAAGAPGRGEDIHRFVSAYQRGPSENWWRENVDLPRYFSYRSILECVHHYDIGNGKNYFYYHHPRSQRWRVLPWDVDLTWRDHMFGNGQEPFYRAGLLRHENLRIEFQNRLREIRDLLFNPEQTGALLDELAAVISDPGGGLSFVDADRAKWDYHPIMASRHVQPFKAGHGMFYQQSRTRDFRGMVQMMKEYIQTRGAWCDAQLLKNSAIPPKPELAADGSLDFSQSALKFRASLRDENAAKSAQFEWRLAEVTLGPIIKPLVPRHYEIEPLWQDTGSVQMQIPLQTLALGRTYRVRVRVRDDQGQCSHWSEPVQFTFRRN